MITALVQTEKRHYLNVENEVAGLASVLVVHNSEPTSRGRETLTVRIEVDEPELLDVDFQVTAR